MIQTLLSNLTKNNYLAIITDWKGD